MTSSGSKVRDEQDVSKALEQRAATSNPNTYEQLHDIAKLLQKFVINLKKMPKERASNMTALRVKESHINEYWTKFEGTISKLVPTDQTSDLRFEMSELYQEAIIYIHERMQLASASTDQRAPLGVLGSEHSVEFVRPQIKLPPLPVPTFNGSHSSWTSFKDQFIDQIHSAPHLSDVQKLYYLKSNLFGDAKALLQNLPLTNDNYDIAWTTLKSRYDNKRIIVNDILITLFNQKKISVGSSRALRNLLDTTKGCVRLLVSQGVNILEVDIIICFIITSCLDIESRKQWELHLGTNNNLPTFSQLDEFLESRARGLDAVATPRNVSNFQANKAHVKSFVSKSSPKCPLCNSLHYLFSCSTFLSWTISQRNQFVRSKNLCRNCLAISHQAHKCPSSGRNHKCNKLHHSLLHNFTKPIVETPKEITTSDQKTISLLSNSSSSQTILATALIAVISVNNTRVLCRALIDPGSQTSFVTEATVQRLKLRKIRELGHISGISDAVNITSRFKTTLCFASIHNSNEVFSTDAYALKQITSLLPSKRCSVQDSKTFNNLPLADPHFGLPGSIDILLGADIYSSLLQDGLQRSNSLVAINSKLGWLVVGKTQCQKSTHSLQSFVVTTQEPNLETLVKTFWELEEVPVTVPRSQEESECEFHFVQHVNRNSEGRIVVELPRRDSSGRLGRSYDKAVTRHRHLESKFRKHPIIKEQYVAFMKEYLQLGHMEECDDHEGDHFHTYLHHAVFKDSTTTKCRVVFDASSKTSTNISFNDTLMVGPTIQPTLLSHLIRFRIHPFVVTADLEKMYRQVLISKSQEGLQRIVWREDDSKPFKSFQLNTVTYGTASAPFLATRALTYISTLVQSTFPSEAQLIKTNFYVDDIIFGRNSIAELREHKVHLTHIFSQFGMSLRKWNSNVPSLRDPTADNVANLNLNHESKLLGLRWNSSNDNIIYTCKFDQPSSITKRQFFSIISRLFDPLGLLTPITISAKMLMQDIWRSKVDWDESIPVNTFHTWSQYVRQLSVVSSISIPRQVLTVNYNEVEIHGFCDASQRAYGAAVYLLSKSSSSSSTHLLISKSKLAPLKTTTIPRLELCGAVLLTKLLRYVQEELQFFTASIFCWSDSTIVLHWINSDCSRWKTFVSNRVAEIQRTLPSACWRHIPTNQNPADLISRGVLPTVLQSSQLWWEGPTWLTQPHEWPPSLVLIAQDTVPEQNLKSLVVRNVDNTDATGIFGRISTFSKLIRIIAYTLRFAHNCRNNTKLNQNLTAHELVNATNKLLYCAQQSVYAQEFKQLINSKPLHRRSPLYKLSPVLRNGLLCVGGRLQNADYLSLDQQHPIILPPRHVLTDLLIRHYHYKHLHMGPQSLLYQLRLQYWPIHGLRTVKGVLRNCVLCFRCNPRTQAPLMGSLPDDRVSQARPFSIVGIDFAGPILIRASLTKRATLIKAYIVIFVCFITKAIHLDLTISLSTPAFLETFKRFISRRGLPATIWSDNGRNFVGAAKELAQLFAQQTDDNVFLTFLANNSITWKFIPPRSPHMGGLWEAGVKSTKTLLKRAMGQGHTTFECTYTLLTQVEACLNSRPLSPLSNDPDDLLPLTPAHFLVGGPLLALPEPSLNHVAINSLTLYQSLTLRLQNFWTRWRLEYLNHLQPRSKWSTTTPTIQVGDLVIIRDEASPPLQWPMGRVRQLHPGPDGSVRVATVRTTAGEYKRAVARLCILPKCNSTSTPPDESSRGSIKPEGQSS